MDPLICAPEWENISSISDWNSSWDHYSYACEYKEYLTFKDFLANLEQHMVFVIAVVGLLGGGWTVATFMQPLFWVSDFFLFRLIGYLETVQMALVAMMNMIVHCNCDRSYICYFFWAHVATTASNVCADSVDLIVLFLCIERSIACLLPHVFHLIHTRSCYYSVALWSLITPTLFSTFQAFELHIVYDPMEGRYADQPSKFASSAFYDGLVKVNTARFYITAFLIACATLFSVIGFRRMTKRKQLLSQSSMHSRRTNSDSSPRHKSKKKASESRSIISLRKRQSMRTENARRLKKRQRDLCCLQLCLAVPIIINHILYAIGTSNFSSVVGLAVFEKNLTFEMAMLELDEAQSFDYLRLATNLSNVLVHGLHFYLYVLFSVKVRHGFLALWKAGRRKMFRLGSIKGAHPNDNRDCRRSVDGSFHC